MIDTDLLIVGSGFAGLWAAIAARDAGIDRVLLVDKAAIALSSQSKMSAGATIYCLDGDDADMWLRDVAEAQGYLCHQDMVADMLATSERRLRCLESWGVTYQRVPLMRRYMRLPSRGFKHVRMLVRPQWGKRVGGAAVIGALKAQVTRRRVQKRSRLLVTGLLTGGGRVAGAVGIDRSSGAVEVIRARAVLLAAGDCSFRGNYIATDHATGDAFRLAYDAGARLSNMEFLAVNTGSPSYGFEGTGVILRRGGRLLNAQGKPFLADYDPDADAAEIGALVQSMAREVRRGHGPPFYLDLRRTNRRRLSFMLSRAASLPRITLEKLAAAGVDIFRTPQEWVPAVQSLRGGVRTDIDGRSDVPGLFAAGLAQAFDPGLFNGWSSMRAMWAGERVGRAAAAFVREAGPVSLDAEQVEACTRAALTPLARPQGPEPDEVIEALQRALFPFEVCILKSADRLRSALETIEHLAVTAAALHASDPHELAKAHETANMVRTAELFLRASLARTESRGDHCREDYPDRDDRHWLRWITLRRGERGAAEVATEPVPLSNYALHPAGDPVP
ncbi:FAD-binding protein [Candidatus Binatia bacterium]|nr:FAD-binding protein [Candidatus Binatia bacterium]